MVTQDVIRQNKDPKQTLHCLIFPVTNVTNITKFYINMQHSND